MPNFEDVRHLLDKFYPHGSKREIWWVTEESLKNECSQCGRCCAMFGLTFTIDDMKRIYLDKDSDVAENPGVRFLVNNMAQIPETEAEARGADGGGARFVCCTKLTEEGECAVYEDRPSFCRQHPHLGQSVVSECAFAGIKDYDKSPRGLEQARLAKIPVFKTKYEVEFEDGPTPN